MNRQIVYAGQVLPETTLLNMTKDAMIGLGMALQAILGTSTLFDGLACTPTGPASLQVLVGPGSVQSFQNVDSTAFSSLAADTAHQIVKQGISLGTLTLNCPAPGTTGQSINYLIQGAYQDTDGGATVLPYYNSSNPAVAYNGPNNTGVSQNTVRQGQCLVAVKAGVAATTGSQTTPAPDAGYTALYVVTVANGQTTITSGNISVASGAPFISEKLTSKISLATGDGRYVRLGSGGTRNQLSANTTFHIATTGNDSTGDGSTGNPWLTRQHAWNTVQSLYDIAGFTVTFQLSDGTYTDSFAATGLMVGQFSPGQVVFNGNSGTPTNVLINCSGGSCFGGINSAYQVQNLKFQNSGGNGIFAQNQATIVMGAGLTAGACSGSKIRASYAGQLFINGSYTDIGNAQQHYEMDNGGQIIVMGGITITESGTPTYSTAYASLTTLGSLLFQNTPTSVPTFSGAASGPRYYAELNSIIQTQGSGASYIPGSTSGSTATGGQYA